MKVKTLIASGYNDNKMNPYSKSWEELGFLYKNFTCRHPNSIFKQRIFNRSFSIFVYKNLHWIVINNNFYFKR